MKSGVPDWDAIFSYLNSFKKGFELPSVSLIGEESGTPFRILISTLISLRTRDEVTLAASRRLFDAADTPPSLRALPLETIEKLIYPCGFYRTKAENMHRICDFILNDHGGKVPDRLEDLLAFPGVGLKTANLVLSLGFGIPAICVDTHVHRISNRMGWIKTGKPDDSVKALEGVLPKKHWIEINELLVLYGQQVCTPRNPICSHCSLSEQCHRVDVNQSR